MNKNNSNLKTIIAVALLLAAFISIFWYMPVLVLWAGQYSPWFFAPIFIGFLVLPFAAFWLRTRYINKNKPD